MGIYKSKIEEILTLLIHRLAIQTGGKKACLL